MTDTQDLPIALTSGDPAGIGPDISLMSWLSRNERHVPVFALLADRAILEDRARALGLDAPCRQIGSIAEAANVFAEALPILQIDCPKPSAPGAPSVDAASAIIGNIEQAVALTMNGEASAVVTNPIAKHVLTAAGFPHPGHTEFLGALAHASGFEATPVMMLAGPNLRVVPVTVHIPLARVSAELTVEYGRSARRREVERRVIVPGGQNRADLALDGFEKVALGPDLTQAGYAFDVIDEAHRGGHTEIRCQQRLLHLLQRAFVESADQHADVGQRDASDPIPERCLFGVFSDESRHRSSRSA
jgi:4-hydroxythreonine-4-phosphate dehydrogenase